MMCLFRSIVSLIQCNISYVLRGICWDATTYGSTIPNVPTHFTHCRVIILCYGTSYFFLTTGVLYLLVSHHRTHYSYILIWSPDALWEGRKFPSFPSLCSWRGTYFHFWLDCFCYEKRLFSELRTWRRNPDLKAVDYVIHIKLRDSRKTMWFT